MLPSCSGVIVADAPRTRNILKILLPTTLPIAMPGFPFRAAATEVASSGREVPQATMVSPMTASLTPNALAISDAPLTKRSPPNMSAARPAMINSDAFVVGICGSMATPFAAGSVSGDGVCLA